MKKRPCRVAAELCGAVVGAGFASGKEIAGFFARFGPWSWLGVAAAAAAVGWITLQVMRHPGAAGMPLAWRGRWMAHVWRGLFAALLISAGGAMLAAGSEVAALLLPLHGARLLGLGAMLLVAWLMLGRETPLLAVLSRGLILCLLAVAAAGLFLPANPSVPLRPAGSAAGVLYGLCYGGFNTALAAPVIAEAGMGLTRCGQRRCALGFAAVMAVLLACGNAVLLRHGTLQDAQLPFVMLLVPLGRFGYVLGSCALAMAALTTLTACLRGLNLLLRGHIAAAVAGMLLLSAGGLESIVEVVYPALGAGCFLLLAAAQLHYQRKM